MPPAARTVFLLLFIGFPLVELALLVHVAGIIGFWSTIAIIFGTAVLGLTILSRQGLNTLARATDAMAAGRMPFEHLTDGAMLLLAGALLLAPGLITDTLGLLLLIPPVRRLITRWGFSLMTSGTSGSRPNHRRHQPEVDGNGTIIDGEFERIDERAADSHRRRDPDDTSSQ